MHQYKTTTTTWLPSSDSRYWTCQKWLSSWQHWSVSTSMSRRQPLCRYLMMIQTSQHWIPMQTHLWWVSRAAPLSRLTRKQPHPVKNPLDLSVLSCVHSVKFTKKACRPCFLPKRLQQDHFYSLLTRTSLINVTRPHSNRWAANQSNCNCSEGNWFVYCRPCFCWCSLYGRRDGLPKAIVHKKEARSKSCEQTGPLIWLNFCMQTWLGILIMKEIF